MVGINKGISCTTDTPHEDIAKIAKKIDTNKFDVTIVEDYIKLPLPFIRLLLVMPQQTDKVIRCCIYIMSLNYDADTYNVARQVVYCFYQDEKSGTKRLPAYIKEKVFGLADENKMTLDFDYNGFSQDGDLDEEQVTDLVIEFNDDVDFFEQCKEWYKLRQVTNNVGVVLDDVELFRNAFVYFSKYRFYHDVFGYVHRDLIFQYRDKANHGIVPEYERVQFACYCGIKSIIGLKDYGVATKNLILARMMGLRKAKDLEAEILNKKERTEANKILKKYSNRRFLGLLNCLLKYNYLKCCFGRKKVGYYLSSKLTNNEVMSKVLYDERWKKLDGSRVQEASTEFRKKISEMKKHL